MSVSSSMTPGPGTCDYPLTGAIPSVPASQSHGHKDFSHFQSVPAGWAWDGLKTREVPVALRLGRWDGLKPFPEQAHKKTCHSLETIQPNGEYRSTHPVSDRYP